MPMVSLSATQLTQIPWKLVVSARRGNEYLKIWHWSDGPDASHWVDTQLSSYTTEPGKSYSSELGLALNFALDLDAPPAFQAEIPRVFQLMFPQVRAFVREHSSAELPRDGRGEQPYRVIFHDSASEYLLIPTEIGDESVMGAYHVREEAVIAAWKNALKYDGVEFEGITLEIKLRLGLPDDADFDDFDSALQYWADATTPVAESSLAYLDDLASRALSIVGPEDFSSGGEAGSVSLPFEIGEHILKVQITSDDYRQGFSGKPVTVHRVGAGSTLEIRCDGWYSEGRGVRRLVHEGIRSWRAQRGVSIQG